MSCKKSREENILEKKTDKMGDLAKEEKLSLFKEMKRYFAMSYNLDKWEFLW